VQVKGSDDLHPLLDATPPLVDPICIPAHALSILAWIA
jgi:hypothetical protein